MSIQRTVTHRERVILSPAYTAAAKIRTGAYWKMDEATGATRLDSIGSRNLADVNSVVQGAGKINYAASFAPLSLNYLTVADDALFSAGNSDLTIGGWVNLNSVPVSTMFIAAKGTGLGFLVTEYALYYSSTRTFRFIMFDGAGNGNNAIVSSPSPPLINTWYFLMAWYDSARDLLSIQLDNGTVYSTAYTQGSWDSAYPFRVGANSTPSNYFDGLIDEFFFCKQLFTPEERAFLYNNGNGQTWPWI